MTTLAFLDTLTHLTALPALISGTGRRRRRARNLTPQPIVLCRDAVQPPVWEDAGFHAEAWATDPATYVQAALLPETHADQRAKTLFQALRSSWETLDAPTRETVGRACSLLAETLDPDAALNVFLALRRVRANHRHVSRGIVTFLLNHPHAAELWARRRPAVVDVLEHALGRNVLRACRRRIREGIAGTGDPYLRRHLLRWADQPAEAWALLARLDRADERAGTATVPSYRVPVIADLPSGTVTADNRGDTAALLTRFYRDPTTEAIGETLNATLDTLAARLPAFAGRVGLVLDVSASMRGYGDREWCILAQTVAFRLALNRVCANVDLYPVGGAARMLAIPKGDTDLAGALLDALDAKPDVVLIVSDGYENRCGGDLAQIASTLSLLDTHVPPVIFVHAQFTATDDLTRRRPAPSLPSERFWHENDFAGLLLRAWARTSGTHGDNAVRAYLHAYLHAYLARTEKETTRWTRF